MKYCVQSTTNLNLQVDRGDGLDEVFSRRCRNLKAEDADLLIVQRLDQTDQARFPVHQESPPQVAVNSLPSDSREEPALSGAHVHRPQRRPYGRVLRDGEGVLWLAEGGDERIWWNDVDEC